MLITVITKHCWQNWPLRNKRMSPPSRICNFLPEYLFYISSSSSMQRRGSDQRHISSKILFLKNFFFFFHREISNYWLIIRFTILHFLNYRKRNIETFYGIRDILYWVYIPFSWNSCFFINLKSLFSFSFLSLCVS